MSGLIEDMIYNGATDDEIKEAIKNIKRGKQILDTLESFREKYQSDNRNKVTYRSYYGNTYKSLTHNSPYIPYINGIICESRDDAEKIIDKMADLINKYGMASVADLYDLASMSPNYCKYYKNDKYGWEDEDKINSATITRLRKNEYVIKFPAPVCLY